MSDGTSFSVRAQVRRRLLLLAQQQFDSAAFRLHASAAQSSLSHRKDVLRVPFTVEVSAGIVTPPATKPLEVVATCVDAVKNRFGSQIADLSNVARSALFECYDCPRLPYLCFDLFWYFLLRDHALPALLERAQHPVSLASPGMHHFMHLLAISDDSARSLLTTVFVAMANDGRRTLSAEDLAALCAKIDVDLPAASWLQIIEETGLGSADRKSLDLEDFLTLLSFQFMEDARIEDIKNALTVLHQRSSVLFISIVSPVRYSLHTRDLITTLFAHGVAQIVTAFMQQCCDECMWDRGLSALLEQRVSAWFSGVGSSSASDTTHVSPIRTPRPPSAPTSTGAGTANTAGNNSVPRMPTVGDEIKQQLQALRWKRSHGESNTTGQSVNNNSGEPPTDPSPTKPPDISTARPQASPRSVVGTFLTEVRRPMSASLRKGMLDLKGRTEAFQSVLVTSRFKHVLHTTEARGTALTVRPSAAAADILRRGEGTRAPYEYKTKQLGNVPLILTATAERTIAKHARRLQQRFQDEEETRAKDAHRISSALLAKYDDMMTIYETAKKSDRNMTLHHSKLLEEQGKIDAFLGTQLVVHVSEVGRAMLVQASTTLGIMAKQLQREERFAAAHGGLR